MKAKYQGWRRIAYANVYSMKGFIAAWKDEAAFRQELVALIVLAVIASFFPLTTLDIVLMTITAGLVLITELLNSAIETLVDRISPDFHQLSGKAKDIGSAAVFVALVVFIITWASILWPKIL
ncbi:diacylglycerol kinase [Idiomarina tyrosinivorans]|uniref:Diacylglycerol kinase n=1 Tax=Idiomarina tyrosinivorans TaxID=1445662 RepID=A0A432ZSS8_9GAMM|nr:diacylglycerol kinase [Idiomarina tyrosinivorans]RUO80984.1 diacylglycerol kinase [Idiomarina tyrosinivorans]